MLDDFLPKSINPFIGISWESKTPDFKIEIKVNNQQNLNLDSQGFKDLKLDCEIHLATEDKPSSI